MAAADDSTAVRWRGGRVPPLLPWAAGLVLGIVLDDHWPVAGRFWPALVGVAVVGLLAARGHLRANLLLAGLAALGAGGLLHHRTRWQVPADHVVAYTRPEPVLARLTGRVVDRPRIARRGYEPFAPWLFENDRTAFILMAESIAGQDGPLPVSGRVRVSVKEAVLAVEAGDRVEVFGWLHRPVEVQNPGQFDWALFSIRHGARAHLAAEWAENVRILQRAADDPWPTLQGLRTHVRRLLLDQRLLTSGPRAALVDAIVLGGRADLSADIERSFVRTGCAHYLAVSGANVGMVALPVWLGLGLLGVGRRGRALAVMTTAVVYALAVDPQVPIMRAAVMACAVCLGWLGRRRVTTLSALALAAVVILTTTPTALFDAGFQLSFGAVAGIAYLGPALAAAAAALVRGIRSKVAGPVTAAETDIAALALRLDPPSRSRAWLTRALTTAGAATAAAWLMTLPITAGSFGQVPLWGWLNSLLAGPLVFVTTVLGFAKLLLALAVPAAGEYLNWPLELSGRALLGLLRILERVAGTALLSAPWPFALIVTYYVTGGALVAWQRRLLAPRLVAICGAALAAALGGWMAWNPGPGCLRITQLAVGQGSATVLELPDGRAWIYDAGAAGGFDPGAGIVGPALRQRGVRRIEGIIISHPNLDHFSGVPGLLEAVPAGPVYVHRHFRRLAGDRTPAAALLDDLERRGQPVVEIDRDTDLSPADDVRFEVLWPPLDTTADLEANDSSLVVRVSYAGRSVLLTGDIGPGVLRRLREQGNLTADVLILPHHGRNVGGLREFADDLGAAHLVCSGSRRTADHPDLLHAAGPRSLWNTADVGAVEIELDARGVRVRGFRQPSNALEPERPDEDE